MGVERFDLVLAGGGLANGLVALALAERRPDVRVLVLESGDRLGGNHTWSFHAHDLSPAAAALAEPLVEHRWPAYSVRFPERRRRIATGYRSVSSDRFAAVLTPRLGDRVRFGATVAHLEPSAATLADGTRVEAGAVLDGRGPEGADMAALDLGYQKFLGIELRTRAPHGLSEPIVMDATVSQDDGYRFVYSLPFAPDRLLVEDTYYADGARLDRDRLHGRVFAYAAGHGWDAVETVREEAGVLPIALGGDIDLFWSAKRGVPASGLRAALFHPTTGYSLPDALAFAQAVAAAPDLSAPALFALVREHSIRRWRARGFFRMLNRMLFRAGAPERRFEVLQHFHRLPDDLVGRFYAADLTAADKLRILAGRPPVPVAGAVRALLGRSPMPSKEPA